MPEITLRQLELFCAAAQNGSFVAAAEVKFISPNAVATAVTELERVMKVQLVVRRKAKGITLTPAGRELQQRALLLLENAVDITQTVGQTGGELRGPVRVGCYATLGATVVPELYTQVENQLPKVDLTVVEGTATELAQRLFSGELDLIVVYRAGLPAGLEAQQLFETRPQVLLPAQHRLANAATVNLAEIVEEPLILLNLPPAGDNTLDLLRSQNLIPKVGHRASSVETVRSLVARGFGYTIMFQQPLSSMSYEGLQLVAKQLDPPLRAEPMMLATVADVEQPARVKAVWKIITEMNFSYGNNPKAR